MWTFHLRDDVYFHDGTQLTSADVAYSANHWKSSETSILATTFEVVDSIETPDDFTVVFNLTAPVVTFPLTVMDYRARVVPVDGLPGVLETGMGSGPFKLETLDVEGVTVLVANDDYWDGPPGVAAIEVYGIADVEAQVTALLSGQLDWQPLRMNSHSGSKATMIMLSPRYQGAIGRALSCAPTSRRLTIWHCARRCTWWSIAKNGRSGSFRRGHCFL